MKNLKTLLSSFKESTQMQSFFSDDVNAQMSHIVFDLLTDNYIEILLSLDQLTFVEDIVYSIEHALIDNKYPLEKRYLLCRVLFVIHFRRLKESEDNIVQFSKTSSEVILFWKEEINSKLISDHNINAKFASQFGTEMTTTLQESMNYRKKLFASFEDYIVSKDKTLYSNFYSALQLLYTNNIDKLQVNTW
jgi:hypothetical protein